MPRRIILPLLLLALSVLSAQAAYKAFWVTEAISGITVGPVVNKPGNRFVAGGSSWVVLDSRPGEINFADARTLAVQGPYALAEQHMFELGELAYVFTRVEDYKGDRPGDDASRVSQARRAPAQKAEEPGSRDLPERWVLGPVPSTNPAAHKDAVEPWSIPTLSLRPAVVGFVDLVDKVQYDWKLGGLSGSRKQSLQVVRAGVSGEWNGFHADLGISTGGKTSGTLVKDGLAVSRLRIRGGKGLFAEAGYDYSFLLDDEWSVSVGGAASWQRIGADISAHCARKVSEASSPFVYVLDDAGNVAIEQSAEGQADTYEFGDWSSDLTIEDLRVAAAVGLRYDQWYWGLGARFQLDCFGDVSADVDIPALNGSYGLSAKRSQPVSLVLSGWYSPVDNWYAIGALSFGGETRFRVGVGYFF